MNIFPLNLANVRAGSLSATFAPPRMPALSSAAIMGIGLVSILPAMFWTLLIWMASYAFGWNVSAATLATIASAIAVFLSVVCSAIIAAA